MRPLRLSVLDMAPIRPGATAADALRESLHLAEAADQLGYTRYWLAEHHATAGLACPSPEVMIGPIAARTTRIRVGSGGIMLSHYSPLKVAESFRMLEALYPGRIDLGVGRGRGGDDLAARALTGGRGMPTDAEFAARVRDLLELLHDTVPADHPYVAVRISLGAGTAPQPWLLGSNTESARLAATYGTAYAFAHFLTPEGGEQVLEAYRRVFQPSPTMAAPRVGVAVSAVCADDEASLHRLQRRCEVYLLWLHLHADRPFPTDDEIARYTFDEQERALLPRLRERTIFGTPDQLRERLTVLADRYGADELIVTTATPDAASRLGSYHLLAQAVGLDAIERQAAA
jgi:luciferase family oxidoreductase group 1